MMARRQRGRARAVRFAKRLAGAAAATALIAGVSACSFVPEWANPVEWYDAVFEDNEDRPPPANRAPAAGRSTAASGQSTGQAGGQTFPRLGSTPERPQAPSSADERRQIARGLVADRDNVRYSGDSLRQRAASVPPPAPPAAPSAPSPVPAVRANLPPPPPPAAATAAPNPSVPAPATSGQSGSYRSLSGRQIQIPSIVQRRRNITPGPLAPSPAYTASRAPRPSALTGSAVPPPIPAPPAAPPMPAAPAAPAATASSQIGATVGASAIAGDQTTLARTLSANLQQQQTVIGGTGQPLGQPQGQLAGQPPSQPLGGPPAFPGEPIAIVKFSHGGTRLTAEARRTVDQVASMAKTRQGLVRVVGHASQRTGDMPFARHLTINFNVSHDRARVVAAELVKQGVAADRILIEAKGAAEPRFYEFMPNGEAENRRAEIYLE